MSYGTDSIDSSVIRGNLVMAKGNFTPDTISGGETIDSGLGELMFSHVHLGNFSNSNANGTPVMAWNTNETKNGTSSNGDIGVTYANCSGVAGEWFAIGFLS